MFEDLEVANKEYDTLKEKYEKLVTAKAGQDSLLEENKKTIENARKEIDRLKIQNYNYFEQLSQQNNSKNDNNNNNSNNHNEDENVSIADIIDKIF